MSELVADVGNSRIKWGIVGRSQLDELMTLPLDEPAAWEAAFRERLLPDPRRCTIAGTNPDGRNRLATWLRSRGSQVNILDDYHQVPITVLVDKPETVGIDRLLNAAAISQKAIPAIVVCAGSAVTVDLVDREGAFRGGAIFPGFRLMAKSLRDYTARLPYINPFPDIESIVPGTNTKSAIEAGIAHAVHGGIDRLVRNLRIQAGPARVFLAGGDAHLLTNLECQPEVVGPYLTLEGMRLTLRKPT